MSNLADAAIALVSDVMDQPHNTYRTERVAAAQVLATLELAEALRELKSR